jgi:hypothetical protein
MTRIAIFLTMDRFANLSGIGRLILALLGSWHHHCLQGQQNGEQESSIGNVQACSVWVVSNQMEAAMCKFLATITGTLAILAATLLASDRAEAGASASAPSKYAHTSQVATVYQARTGRQARNPKFGITEYSSSSARNPSRGHAYR